MGQLRVGYPYYKDFSQWLQRQSFKHMAGNVEASGAILEKIRYTELSKRDIDICLGFNNKRITGAVLSNHLIKNVYTYKLLIQKRLYRNKYFLRQALYGFAKGKTLVKIKMGILKRLNKDYKNKEKLAWEELLDCLYSRDEMVPSFPVVSYVIVKANILYKEFYSWRRDINWSGKMTSMDSTTIKEYIKEVLKEDIDKAGYNITSSFFKRVSKEKANKGDFLETFLEVMPYVKNEIIPNIHSTQDASYHSQIESLMNNLFDAHKAEIVSSEYLIDFINKMHTEGKDAVSNLIKLLQTQKLNNEEVETIQDNFRDKVKNIINKE